MTTIAIFLVKFYQSFLSGFLRQVLGVQSFCRYTPTCSQYAIISLKQYGILYGSFKAVQRLLKCQPFAKSQ